MLDFHSKQSLSRLRRQLPLHKGAFLYVHKSECSPETEKYFDYHVNISMKSLIIAKYSFSCQEVYFECCYLFQTRQVPFELEVELLRGFLLYAEVQMQVHLPCPLSRTSNIKNKE